MEDTERNACLKSKDLMKMQDVGNLVYSDKVTVNQAYHVEYDKAMPNYALKRR